ncbi:hypothetical protein [Streptomyces sp. NBC_01476]|uniref:hypothetical protein n=1 Tax=Streptomyces sp. NBC_01476 TaxID=2903881 RepID=UPI002E37FD0C|nr:hypothetical protein [Streptomyces sp. NBC_01476]
MRNPVGPLPSSIYWRRRAVALCLLALVIAIVVWGLTSGGGGGGGGNGSGAPSGSHTPVATITPGPDPSGTHISGRPGGRDTSPSGDGAANGGSDDGGSAAGAGSAGDTAGSDGATTGGTGGGTAGSGGSDGTAAGGTGASGGGSSSSGGSTTGGELPVGSTLPDCAPGAVQLSLASAQNTYSPGQTPAFQLRATNSSDITCKVDFAPSKAVFTITRAADNSHVWASNDCPATGSHLMQVPAHGSTTYTLRWNGKTSSPQCAKPKGQQAAPGTYLVQAALAGYGSKQASFVLSAD